MARNNRFYISNKSEKFPFLASMYDPTDKGHTRGDILYFMDQVQTAINEWDEIQAAEFDDIPLKELEIELAKLKELESLGITYIVVEED